LCVRATKPQAPFCRAPPVARQRRAGRRDTRAGWALVLPSSPLEPRKPLVRPSAAQRLGTRRRPMDRPFGRGLLLPPRSCLWPTMDGPNERYEDGAYVVVLWIIRRQHSAGIFEPHIVAEDGLLHRRRTTAITVETTPINRPNITEIHRGACPEFSVAATQGRGQQQHQQAADDPEGEAPGAPMDPVSECIHLILHVRSKIRRYGADSQTPTHGH